jgi:hypothetical protein
MKLRKLSLALAVTTMTSLTAFAAGNQDPTPVNELKPIRKAAIRVEIDRSWAQQESNGTWTFHREPVCIQSGHANVFQLPDSSEPNYFNATSDVKCTTLLHDGTSATITIDAYIALGTEYLFSEMLPSKVKTFSASYSVLSNSTTSGPGTLNGFSGIQTSKTRDLNATGVILSIDQTLGISSSPATVVTPKSTLHLPTPEPTATPVPMPAPIEDQFTATIEFDDHQ